MPFKSEKQRRLLWAKHPEIAKRWAHEYPESNKGLPMYADDNNKDPQASSGGKEAQNRLLEGPATPYLAPILAKQALIAKKSESILEPVEMPNHEGPSYALMDEPAHGTGTKSLCAASGEKLENTQKIAGILRNLTKAAWGGNMHKRGIVEGRVMQQERWNQEAMGSLFSGAPLPPRPISTTLSGKSYLAFLDRANSTANQARLNATIPPPIGSQGPAQNPAPVATYPGMNSAPQSSPQTPAPNQPFSTTGKPTTGGMKGMSNTIGRLGGLTSDNGMIAKNQDIGSTGFGNAPNTPKSPGAA